MKRMPISSTGIRHRSRACNAAANHSLHSDHCSGHFQRHSDFAVLDSLCSCKATYRSVFERNKQPLIGSRHPVIYGNGGQVQHGHLLPVVFRIHRKLRSLASFVRCPGVSRVHDVRGACDEQTICGQNHTVDAKGGSGSPGIVALGHKSHVPGARHKGRRMSPGREDRGRVDSGRVSGQGLPARSPKHEPASMEPFRIQHAIRGHQNMLVVRVGHAGPGPLLRGIRRDFYRVSSNFNA